MIEQVYDCIKMDKDVFEFLERNNFKQHDSVWINLSRV